MKSENSPRDSLGSILQKQFGYNGFLPLQEEIITDVLSGRDVFSLMPTGGGKSLCYQLPAVVQRGLTVVVSPLIALMKDQVDSLLANGIRAAFLNSSITGREAQTIQAMLVRNEIRILYVAPERIMLANFLPFLKQLRIDLFAIDEAHCISEWGHDFRPEYRQLRMLKSEFPGVPIIALTATAEPRVQKDIISELRLRDPHTYIASFDRKNLSYHVQPKDQPYQQLLKYLRAHKNDSGIIYCQSRKSVEALSGKLARDGFRSLPYHAGLPARDRTEHQERFIRDNVDIIVATIAFGMGINKPNVRFVIHYDLPKNIESYYQETGRAGRDGLPGECILYFSYGDLAKQEYFIAQKLEDQERQIASRKLREMVQYCETSVCRRKTLLRYFGEEYLQPRCGNCDNCVNPKDSIDGTIIAQKILSCVSRVGERFGALYIADILRGSHNQKIIHNGHASLPTFGIGKEFSQSQWFGFIRELIQLGYLETRGEQYPVLALNEKSNSVLRKREQVILTKPSSEKRQEVKVGADENYDGELFEKLRQLRKEIAGEANLPPYVIFHDRTLRDMSVEYPVTLDELKSINGVGEAKLSRYGDAFLRIIQDHCESKGLRTRRVVSEPTPKLKLPGFARAKTYSLAEMRLRNESAQSKWTKEEDENLILNHLSGHSPAELATIFGRQESVIRSRLKKLGLG